MTWHNMSEDGNSIHPEALLSVKVDETSVFLNDAARPKALGEKWGLRFCGKLRPRPKGTKQFQFGVIVGGRAKLFVNGKLVIDNWTKQRHGQAFFGSGTVEETGIIDVAPGESPEILLEFSNLPGPRENAEESQLIQPCVKLSGKDVIDPEENMANAVAAAKEADVAVVIVGLNSDWETEGYDRKTLDLPGRTNELVTKVAAVNKKTVVITQSVSISSSYSSFIIISIITVTQGSAITMPWVDSIPALVHTWYLGNATGDAIADVLFGKVNPSGKLSLTFPRRLEDVPSYGHFGSENGKVCSLMLIRTGLNFYRYAMVKICLLYVTDLFHVVLCDLFILSRVINITCIATFQLYSHSGWCISSFPGSLINLLPQLWFIIYNL